MVKLILSTRKMEIVLLQLHTSYHVSSYCITKCINSGSQIRHNPCARALEILQSMAGKFTTLIWMITHYIDYLVNQNNHQNTSRNTNPYWQEYQMKCYQVSQRNLLTSHLISLIPRNPHPTTIRWIPNIQNFKPYISLSTGIQTHCGFY